MPSLVYIARINQLSEELAGRLRSAGLQVQSFPAGEITADECLLAITPEAIATGIHSANSLKPTPAELTAQATPPLDQLELGRKSQPAIWNVLNQFAATRFPVAPRRPSQALPPIQTGNLGFVPSGLGQRALVACTPSPANSSQTRAIPPPSGAAKPGALLLIGKMSRMAAARIFALLSAQASLLKGDLLRHGLWKPLAATAVLLLFAIALLANRVATAVSFADQTTGVASQLHDSVSASSAPTAAPPLSRAMKDSSDSTPSQSSTNPRRAPATGRHLSDDDFVAEDFTNHYGIPFRSAAAQPTLDLQRNAQDNLRPKRRVVD
jgi:hypothetical protein